MKIIGVLGFLALSLAFGCNNKPAKEIVNETTIEVETEKEADTQIKINSDGGSVKTKKLEVEIKKD